MQRISGNNFYLTRGDTGWLYVTLSVPTFPDDYELQRGDKLYFTVRKTREHEPVISKELDTQYITIEPEDTENLDFGNYVYDVQLVFSWGAKTTVIEHAKFVICSEVTF